MLTEMALTDVMKSQNYLIDIAINNQLMLAYILNILAEREGNQNLLNTVGPVLAEAQKVFKENMKGGVASGLQ